GSGLAYWPYADLVRQVVGIKPDDPPRVATTKLAVALRAVPSALPYFGRLVGAPGTTDDDGEGVPLDPETFRRGLHQAVREWLEWLASTGPLVLAIEDLHWADDSSIA